MRKAVMSPSSLTPGALKADLMLQFMKLITNLGSEEELAAWIFGVW